MAASSVLVVGLLTISASYASKPDRRCSLSVAATGHTSLLCTQDRRLRDGVSADALLVAIITAMTGTFLRVFRETDVAVPVS